LLRVAVESLRRPYRFGALADWWFTTIPACLLIGDHATALQLMREAVAAGAGQAGTRRAAGDIIDAYERETGKISSPMDNTEARTALRLRFKFDPRMAPFRDDPEIVALLAEPKGDVTAAAPSPARELANKALDLIQSIDGTREDFALAEEFCQRALKLDSTDGEVWAIYSEIHAAFGYRGWDPTPERREQTRVTAERAIRLAPTSTLARIAQAGAWSAFNINRAETEKLLRDVVREHPDDKAALKFLAVTVLNGGNLNECLALNERAAALPGGDPLALFNNARYLWQRDRSAEAYATLARSLAQKPTFGSALVLKTNIELYWKGDLAAAEATLKQIPQSALLEDRANFTAGLVYYYGRHVDAALAMWGAFPRDSYSDFAFNGPKGLLIGLVDELDHRDAAAKIEWRAALQVVEKKIAAAPNNAGYHWHKAYLLACLGEKAAAEEELRTGEQLAGFKLTPGSPLSFNQALLYLRLGRLDDFFAHPPAIDDGRLRLDPRFDGVRADPRFEKLVAEYQRLQAAPKP
jgi:Flp pilus assembly protein TadD